MRTSLFVSVWWAAACGGEPVVNFSPARLDFGTVDFAEEVPEGGFAPIALTVRNDGERDLPWSLTTLDGERLCIPGIGEAPVELPDLAADASQTYTVGVCGYVAEAGDRDTLVTGSLRFDIDGASFSVPWGFTPVLGLGDPGDTAD
jgi:hypothetical protein